LEVIEIKARNSLYVNVLVQIFSINLKSVIFALLLTFSKNTIKKYKQ